VTATERQHDTDNRKTLGCVWQMLLLVALSTLGRKKFKGLVRGLVLSRSLLFTPGKLFAPHNYSCIGVPGRV